MCSSDDYSVHVYITHHPESGHCDVNITYADSDHQMTFHDSVSVRDVGGARGHQIVLVQGAVMYLVRRALRVAVEASLEAS